MTLISKSSLRQKMIAVLSVVWVLFQLYYNSIGVMESITLRAVHTLFLLIMIFLIYPVSKKNFKSLDFPLSLGLIAFAIGIFCYFFVNYAVIGNRGGFLLPIDYIVGALGLLLIFEAARRATGSVCLLSVIFLGYAFFGQYLGAFGHSGFSLKRIVSHLFWGSQGVFGVGASVSVSYVFIFILLGSFFKYSGFSDFLNNFSLALVGSSPGGPAKVAVVASGFLGMINGSALANVATTGTLTIPLMKKSGYSAEFAGAVEAAASSAGQFTPPVMGAVGFLMAEYLGVPYQTVMYAAIIPAFLYYFMLLVSVHIEAKKKGLKGIAKENLPSALKVLKENLLLLLPIIILMGLMFFGYTPMLAATCALLATILVSWTKKENRINVKTLLLACEDGAKSAALVGISCVVIGVVVGVVSLTGIGLRFGYAILSFAFAENLHIVAILVMLMSTVLGMGVPGVAAYVIVATVSVPILVRAGAIPITAHLFCLYYASLSNITPPVAMSSYIASGIAESDQLKTSLIAVRLSLAGFILPFFFISNPILLIGATNASIFSSIWVFISACFGVSALATGFAGYFISELDFIPRCVMIFAGLLLIHPDPITDVAAVAAVIIVYYLQLIEKKALKSG